MSGFEVAGVLLGAFPLIISGLEHWRDVAKIRGFWRHVRKEHTACVREIQYHAILYKRNLENLLLPIVSDSNQLDSLLNDPGGSTWKSKLLQERFANRLLDACELYMSLVSEMNEVAQSLKEELCLDSTIIQTRLTPPEARKRQRSSSPQPQIDKQSKLAKARSKLEYETFRIKFSLNEPIRAGLLRRMRECNEKLEKLLSTSEIVSAHERTDVSKKTDALESTLRKAWRKSDHLFKAFQKAWQCSCEEYHFANLRLEHRTLPEICFEVILTFVAPARLAKTSWSWRRLQCGQPANCILSSSESFEQLSIHSQPLQQARNCVPTKDPSSMLMGRKRVAFAIPDLIVQSDTPLLTGNPDTRLCQRLQNANWTECVGIVGHGEEAYHLHPSPAAIDQGHDADPVTLDHILSGDFKGSMSRRQRYNIALLLASSVAQLQFTPWLGTHLTKDDVLFFPCGEETCDISLHEPFVRRGFSSPARAVPSGQSAECNFAPLGILLLELCFGKRLEDQNFYRAITDADPEIKKALDLMAAITWSQKVSEEEGEDYASAIKWCLVTSARKANESWRNQIIKNVIRPLERCQEHFKAVDVC